MKVINRIAKGNGKKLPSSFQVRVYFICWVHTYKWYSRFKIALSLEQGAIWQAKAVKTYEVKCL